jgi:hypothetical protein
MDATKLAEIINLHGKWRRGEEGGSRANLRGANLGRANLVGANLVGANLVGANLEGAYLVGANLVGANLVGANLVGAYLAGAYLADADMAGANLVGANLEGAYLVGATIMPDGRTWDAYRADHLADLCTTPEIHAKALAAWGGHSWRDCPMHAALNINSAMEAPESLRLRVACWVALYDANLLPKPEPLAEVSP